MKASYSCMSLHGGIDQFDRDSTILDFKSGRVKLLIATSVAARGLDVKQLILVVNYDCPNHYEDYVHRYTFLELTQFIFVLNIFKIRLQMW